MTPLQIAREALCEQIAQFLHDEGGFDDAWSRRTWPEHPDDTGQRDGGFVKIVPKDVQAKFREVAARLVRGFKLDDKDTLLRQQQADTTAAETRGWNAAIDAAVSVACGAGMAWHDQWRAGHKADPYLQGMSDGADDIENQIRALAKPEGTPND